MGNKSVKSGFCAQLPMPATDITMNEAMHPEERFHSKIEGICENPLYLSSCRSGIELPGI